MALIKIDVTDIMANVTRQLPSRSDIAELRRNLGDSAFAFWKKQASEGLKSSSRDYIQALSYREQGTRVFIILSGVVPNLIENGFAGGDMRDWLLKGPNAKMGKNGMYNTIPFRHGTPGTSGRNVGPPMPRAVLNMAKKLKQPILSHGKQLIDQGGQPVLYGQRLSPNMRGATRKLREILTTKKKPWHLTGIHTGLMRADKTYEAATGSQYVTFRRISQNRRSGTDPSSGQSRDSWMHPGIKPRRYATKTQEHIEDMLPTALRLAMEGPKRGGGK